MTPFHDLQEYLAIPRLETVRLSPDGRRLVATVSALSADRKKYVTALWEIDPGGEAEPRRLTRSPHGESSPAFLPDGTLLFVSRRPGDQAADRDGDPDAAGLWALPASGGEAEPVAARPGGISAVAVARDAGTIAFTAATLPGAAAADRERRAKRADAGVTAILHDGYPVRHWDHELGPDLPRLYVVAPYARNAHPPDEADPRDVSPQAGQALVQQAAALTPDGSTAVTGWWVPAEAAAQRSELAAIDLATGRRRVLITRDDADFGSPAVLPDGRAVVCVGEAHGTTGDPPDQTLWLVPLDGAGPRDLLPGFGLWPANPRVVARLREHLLHRRPARPQPDLRPRRGRRLGRAAHPGRRGLRRPGRIPGRAQSLCGPGWHRRAAAAVRIHDRGRQPHPVESPGDSLPLPGRVTEVTAKAPDGTAVRGWLVLPARAQQPAPLLLWVHGGPFASWNRWSWRWNPWVMAAHGYAVLLPDPALSTGYGQDYIRRGYGRWGEATFGDLMPVTDAALARDDIDATRTAMMGGSFGGYMANWIAGHTDRFSAIVTHASVWNLEDMMTSDESYYLVREFGASRGAPGPLAGQ